MRSIIKGAANLTRWEFWLIWLTWWFWAQLQHSWLAIWSKDQRLLWADSNFFWREMDLKSAGRAASRSVAYREQLHRVAWPSGLRRWIKAPVSSEAWVQIPPLPRLPFGSHLWAKRLEDWHCMIPNSDVFAFGRPHSTVFRPSMWMSSGTRGRKGQMKMSTAGRVA